MLARALLPLALALPCAAASPAAAGAALPVATSDPVPAPSGDWRVVVTDVEDDIGQIIGFADAGTLARSGNEVRFWLEYRLERAADGGSDGFRGYVTADCSTRVYASRELAELAGSRVVSSGGTENEVTAAPGTNIAVALDNVCAGRFLSGTVDPVAYARAQFGR